MALVIENITKERFIESFRLNAKGLRDCLDSGNLGASVVLQQNCDLDKDVLKELLTEEEMNSFMEEIRDILGSVLVSK